MIKKILGWGVFAILSGALIYGAFYRTVMKADESVFLGSGQSAPGSDAGTNNSRSQGWQNNGERSAGGDPEDSSEEDHVLPAEWIELEGSISQVDTKTLLITTSDGETVLVERGAWRYALEQGFEVRAGDAVRLTGFFENNDFEVVEMLNLSTQSFVVLRDADGKPLWSGGGGN